jgi:hypothetical protein
MEDDSKDGCEGDDRAGGDDKQDKRKDVDKSGILFISECIRVMNLIKIRQPFL